MEQEVKDSALRQAIADAFEAENCIDAYQAIVTAVSPDPHLVGHWESLHRIMDAIREAVKAEK